MLPLALTLLTAASAQLYVSPAGSDSNAGTAAAPFATFAKAQAAARALAPTLTADLRIYFREGSYFQPTTLTLTTADSGASAAAVIRYTGGWPGDAPPATPPTVHSGVPLAGWTLVDPTHQVWSAPLPSGIADTRQVFNASEGAGGASLPKAVAGGLGPHAAITATGYTALAAEVPWLVNPAQSASDVELVYTGVGSSWTECRLRVASVQALAGGVLNITMAQPAWSFHHRAYGQGLGLPASSANVLSGLPTTPGAFAVDTAHGLVYYSSPGSSGSAAAAPQGLVVPQLDVLMALQGDSPAAPLRWVAFDGLAFSYAGWLEPNRGLGYVDMQSGYRLVSTAYDPGDDDHWVPVPGNVQVHDSRNVSFTGCAFAGLGATALAILDSSQSVSVVNNSFAHISCSGVAIGQVSDMNTTVALENGYFAVEGNLFSNIPNEFHDCAAVLGGYVVSSSIAHNSIINASNGGICVSGGGGGGRACARASAHVAVI